MQQEQLFHRLKITLWVLIVIELLFVVSNLGVTASANEGFTQNLKFPHAPSKLGYAIAMSVITLIAILGLVYVEMFRVKFWMDLNVKWTSWPRIAFFGILSAFWIGVLASSVYNCGDLCNAADNEFSRLAYYGVCCACSLEGVASVSCSSISSGIDSGSLVPETATAAEHLYPSGQALSALVMLMFMATAGILGYLRWKHVNSSDAIIELSPEMHSLSSKYGHGGTGQPNQDQAQWPGYSPGYGPGYTAATHEGQFTNL